jgi:acetate kinase
MVLRSVSVRRPGICGSKVETVSCSSIANAIVQSDAAAERISHTVSGLGLPLPDAAGHRVVHGGSATSGPREIDAAFLQELRALIPFAPLHMPSAIRGIDAVLARFPDIPQIACFDTAFHRAMPELAQRYPLPTDLWNQGVRRYGFHGLSFEYIVAALGAEVQGRVLIAHLGNGASLAAVLDGRPLDTTMGFTPAGGLMMGTRSGDLDPGVLIYLMDQKGYTARDLEVLINHRAGLLGVSGSTADMKRLIEQRESDPDAVQAVDLFCYYLRKHIGAMAAVLGGVDTLVFTGGIGEHSAPVRWETCCGLQYLGIVLDEGYNAKDADVISASESTCTVRVIPTDEDLMIARHTYKLIF